MGFDFSQLNQAADETFAEACVFYTDTGIYTIDAIFSEPYTGNNIAGQPVNTPEPTVDIVTALLMPINLKTRDKIVIRGNDYRVVSQTQDVAGMTHIVVAYYGA